MESLIGEVAPFTTASGVEVTAEGLRAELEQVRARGFSLSYGERVLGSRSVAAPVRTREGMVVAAIQIAGTSESFPESRVEALSAAIRNAADALGRRL